MPGGGALYGDPGNALIAFYSCLLPDDDAEDNAALETVGLGGGPLTTCGFFG